MTKVVVACDSFKGSLSAAEATSAVAVGIRQVLGENAEVVEVPVADGGEGTLEMLAGGGRGRLVQLCVRGPLGEDVAARYGVLAGGVQLLKGVPDSAPVAVIELAEAAGLTLLPPDARDPLQATTYGVGQLIEAAYDAGCRSFIIGLGGSATNDGGAGMLQALGARFLDEAGGELPPGGAALERLQSIDISGLRTGILSCRFTVLCDVGNPLCGPDGASAVFGPQKGASAADVAILDRALANYARVLENICRKGVSAVPGAGAAGGTAAAFLAFSNCRLVPGIETALEVVGFDDIVQGASLVVTGEGHMDRQTLAGKAPYGVLSAARRCGVPVVGVAGGVSDGVALCNAGFTAVLPVVSGVCTPTEAMQPSVASANLCRTSSQVARLWFHL